MDFNLLQTKNLVGLGFFAFQDKSLMYQLKKPLIYEPTLY